MKTAPSLFKTHSTVMPYGFLTMLPDMEIQQALECAVLKRFQAHLCTLDSVVLQMAQQLRIWSLITPLYWCIKNDSLSGLNHLNTGDELHNFDLRTVMFQCTDKTMMVFGYDVSCTVKPDDDPGVLYCYRLSSAYFICMAVTYHGKIYVCALYNGTWTGWITI